MCRGIFQSGLFLSFSSVEIDKQKARHCWELAAMNGSVTARYNLGYIEVQTDNLQRAYKVQAVFGCG